MFGLIKDVRFLHGIAVAVNLNVAVDVVRARLRFFLQPGGGTRGFVDVLS